MQCVVVNSTRLSLPTVLKYGAPQGSVLGPILYTMCTKPLSDLISAFDIKFHMYADDTHLFVPFSVSFLASVVANAESCVSAVSLWMNYKILKLTDEKTEILQISNNLVNYVVKEFHLPGMTVNFCSGSVRNLGIHIDNK